jgi:hypothetical protein
MRSHTVVAGKGLCWATALAPEGLPWAQAPAHSSDSPVMRSKGFLGAPRPLAQLTAALRQWIFARSCARGPYETPFDLLAGCPVRSLLRNGPFERPIRRSKDHSAICGRWHA